MSSRENEVGEISLGDLWKGLLDGKLIILAFIFVFSAAAVAYALIAPNLYTSSAVVAPADSSGRTSLSGLAGQLGGLASLAGVNLGGKDPSKTIEAIQVMRSWDFVESFIQEQGIAPEVFAVRGWNKETNELDYDTGLYDPALKKWTRIPQEGQSEQPSSWELYRRFEQDFLSVSLDDITGFVTVSVEYYSPKLAKAWVEALVEKINKLFQERDSEVAKRNIEFLKSQIEETPIANMQVVLYGLVEEQTKTLMLAKGATEYVFRTVSAPREPELRSKPQRALICIFGSMLGLALGVIIVLFRILKVNQLRV